MPVTIAASPRQRAAGFSLIELLVALAIGMLAVLVISQTFLFFEGQKRATTGTASAQVDGNIALYSISRELQGGGFGMLPSLNSPLECARIEVDHDSNGATPTIDALSPVVIIDGAAGTSDSIVIRSWELPGAQMDIRGVAGNVIEVSTSFFCKDPDPAPAPVPPPWPRAVIMNGAACALTDVTAIDPSRDRAALPPPPPPPNVEPPTEHITVSSAAGAVVGGAIACLGNSRESIYTVAPGGLARNGGLIVPNVVNVQAQYGISDAPGLNRVTQWVDATGIWAANAITVANRNRIKAVRIAVIARNGLLERDPVSTACSSITAAQPTGVCAWDATSANPAIPSPAPTVDLSADPNWDRYRYRVFETIIPLRNVIWSRDTL